MRLTVRLLLALLLAMPLLAGTPGTFRGILGAVADRKPGWMFVRSVNDKFRVVKVTGATVYYAEEIPISLRKSIPARSLKPGAEVRVTAQQDENSGDWDASEIEILKLAEENLRHQK
jgi:hypothetical protein